MDLQTLRRVETALSPVGLGCNNFGMKLDEAESALVVRAALDAGVTHFDTAEMYGQGRSEEFLGAALGARRDDAFIATKFSPRPTDQAYEAGDLARRIREACEGSLRRLGTDRIDLYYQHYPDAEAPVEELTAALDELMIEGKVRHIGLSNVEAAQLDAAGEGFALAQVEWSLLERGVEAEVVPAAARHGIGIVPYFPLASGLLTGKYRKGQDFPEGSRLASMPYFASVATEDNLERVERLLAFAEGEGRTLLELAVAWLLAQPEVVSVICGATSPTQVAANAAAAGWVLDADQLEQIQRCLDLSA